MRSIYPRLIAIATAATIFASCGDNTEKKETETTTDTTAAVLPTIIPFAMVNQYPHDNAAFTEGLQYVDGYLFESVGRYGHSDIRKTDLKTGKILQQQKMDKKYFGEGLTVMNGKIYQLTYQEKKGFVYDQKTMKPLQEFTFSSNEGWGLTNDGTNLIYSDGSSNLYYLDPNTFKEVKRISITDQYGPVENINELEFIKGYIYANQWQTDFILKIDPNTAKVVAHADLSALRQQGGIPPASAATSESSPEVLNGIAYDAQNNRIFVTGKNWPKLFEIKLDN